MPRLLRMFAASAPAKSSGSGTSCPVTLLPARKKKLSQSASAKRASGMSASAAISAASSQRGSSARGSRLRRNRPSPTCPAQISASASGTTW
jgi:hypothetical protein